MQRRRKYGGHFVRYFFSRIVTCRQDKTRQDNLGNEIIRTLTSTDNNLLINFLRHVGEGQNLLFIMPHFRVPSTHPWTVSTAIKTKWSLNILPPIDYVGLWKRINLRFSRLFMFWMSRMENSSCISCVFSE